VDSMTESLISFHGLQLFLLVCCNNVLKLTHDSSALRISGFLSLPE